VPRFFLKSLAAWRQVRSAPGCLGASLIAQPLRRVFYTLSAWQDRDALYAFAAAQPHRGIMAGLRPTMRSATFTFWDVPTGQLPLTWDQAQQRLADQARADAASAAPAHMSTIHNSYEKTVERHDQPGPRRRGDVTETLDRP